jgi:hypothetical protein
VIASLLELSLEQVPHFGLYGGGRWFDIFYYFMLSNGWKHQGEGYRVNDPDVLPEFKILSEADSIKGCFYASVPSKTFPGKHHAVVMDMNWTVVHDPNQNQLYHGNNIKDVLNRWYRFAPVELWGDSCVKCGRKFGESE